MRRTRDLDRPRRSVSRRQVLKGVAGSVSGLLAAKLGLPATGSEAHHSAGWALAFNGQGQYVRIPDTAALRLRTNFTLEAWLRPTSQGNVPYQSIAGKLNYLLSAYPEGAGLRFEFECSTNWGAWHSAAAGPFPLNQWYHLAGTYDGTHLRLFVDGQLRAETPVSGLVDPTAHPFGIASTEEWGDFFLGVVDEVRLSTEVRYTSSFSRPSAPFVVDAATLGLWHLDEGSGSLASDASGNGHDGTLLNGPTWVDGAPFNS